MFDSDAFEEFTEEDWALIDAVCSAREATARQQRTIESAYAVDSSSIGQSFSVDPGSSTTDIAFEKTGARERLILPRDKPGSPFWEFRGPQLSVSDITGPTWYRGLVSRLNDVFDME